MKQAAAFVKVAQTPHDQEAYDACTRGLFISEQFVPGTRFSLCSADYLSARQGAPVAVVQNRSFASGAPATD